MNTFVGNNIKKVKEILDKGELVVVPTETVYGLAGNGLNSGAIEKIYELKKRPSNNPLILHFPNKKSIEKYITHFPHDLELLADEFWPGPLTILLDKNENIPFNVTAGLNKVAVRVPKHGTLIELLNLLDYPLAAPSANLYGKISPTQISHVQKYFDGMIEYILDGGQCRSGIESTIIGKENGKVLVYRLGLITQLDLKQKLGYLPEIKKIDSNVPLASGMVKYHYSPDTPCFIFNQSEHQKFEKEFGYILFSKKYSIEKKENIKQISNSENILEAANNLYRIMHELDDKGYQKIFIELLPNSEVGLTLNDKIYKATAKYNPFK